jgi:hypothetical protein
VLYRLGKDIFSGAVGTLAALFLALNFFHIRRGQLINTDTPLVFFVLLAFIPFMLIFGALVRAEGSRKIRLTRSRLVLGVAACLIVLPSALRIRDFYRRTDTLDNRTVAKTWIEQTCILRVQRPSMTCSGIPTSTTSLSAAKYTSATGTDRRIIRCTISSTENWMSTSSL